MADQEDNTRQNFRTGDRKRDLGSPRPEPPAEDTPSKDDDD
jgi:hypothetical protein